MEQEPDWAEGDPEIAALLNFTPVPRRNIRHDGWHPPQQRGFIAWLAIRGKVPVAARAVGRRESGAWSLRNSDEQGEFTAAWDKALALHHMRRVAADPPPPLRAPPKAAPPPPQPADNAGQDAGLDMAQLEALANDDAFWQQLCDSLFGKYLLKLGQEREARLMGCIVEADFYVRQLCWLEVVLDLGDLGDKAVEMLKSLKRGDLHAGQIVATPVSLLLDHLRRELWALRGEPERPPAPELGLNTTGDFSTGGPTERTIPGPSEAELARRAEAQLLWEEKARKDAAAWRERLGLPPLGEEGEGEGAGDAEPPR